MAKSINIILQKQFSEDRTGIVYIRTIENNVIRKKSLGIKLLVSEWERYFNTETKRFRNVKEFNNSSTFNDIIEKALEELGAINNEISNLPSIKKT
jgi:hypothetical protein